MKIISDYVRHYRVDPAFKPVTLADVYRLSSLIIIVGNSPLKPTYGKTLNASIL